MTTLKVIAECAVKAAKDILVDAIKRGQQILPSVLVYRGNEQIAIVSMEHSDRDDMLAMAAGCAVGFEPDQLIVIHDSWMVTTRTNPVTGREWEHGDMQRVVNEHNGLEQGWVTDALSVTSVNKAGDAVFRFVPYAIRGRKVTWKEMPFPDDDDDEVEAGGYIVDELKRIVNMPGPMSSMRSVGQQAVAEEALYAAEIIDVVNDLGYERARAHADCAAVKVMASPPKSWAGFPSDVIVMLSADPGSVRQQVILDSLGRAGFSRS